MAIWDWLVVAFLIMIPAAALAPFIYFYRQDLKLKRAGWQTFANKHGLSFHSPSTIQGVYQGLPIKVKLVPEDKKPFTRLQIRWPHDKALPLPVHQTFVDDPEIVKQSLDSLATTLNICYKNDWQLRFDLQNQTIAYEYPKYEADLTPVFSRFEALHNLLEACLTVSALGGIAVPALEILLKKKQHLFGRPDYMSIGHLAEFILAEIGRETTRRIASNAYQLRCSRCLLYPQPHKVQIGWLQTVTYYGCRACKQSRFFIKGRPLIMCLDNCEPEELSEVEGLVRVNWFVNRALFDFDQVEIINATDEEVERFVVQIGNDTDELRRPHYINMPCTIAPTCRLSENTLRILERTFGQVIHKSF